MSCGRNVIVYDYNGSDGIVNTESIVELRKNNCSGRRYGLKLSAKDLRRLLDKYDPNLNMRNYIIKNNNVRDIAQQYLSYY
jgi:hypothetical protein